MSFRRFDRYEMTPKAPPPKDGLRMGKAGTTWWGKRWIAALEAMSAGYKSRLDRGKTYARTGRAHDLEVKAGVVKAKVSGSRARPYKVEIRITALKETVWEKAIAAMAEKAIFSTELLDGRMPQEIDEAFEAAGASLFPQAEKDLATACSCPDWANPCKHVAAIHYLLGEAFDGDPFLLFELRGKKREEVLSKLRAARSGAPEPKATQKESAIAKVKLGKLDDETYLRLQAPLPAMQEAGGEAQASSGAILRQLGNPRSWQDERTPLELFGPMIRAAAEKARQLAAAEADVADDGMSSSDPNFGDT